MIRMNSVNRALCVAALVLSVTQLALTVYEILDVYFGLYGPPPQGSPLHSGHGLSVLVNPLQAPISILVVMVAIVSTVICLLQRRWMWAIALVLLIVLVFPGVDLPLSVYYVVLYPQGTPPERIDIVNSLLKAVFFWIVPPLALVLVTLATNLVGPAGGRPSWAYRGVANPIER